MEFPVFYRDCFDGWVGSKIDFSYAGCRIQPDAQGRPVYWCFCKGDLCNSESLDDMGSPEHIVMDSHVINYPVKNFQSVMARMLTGQAPVNDDVFSPLQNRYKAPRGFARTPTLTQPGYESPDYSIQADDRSQYGGRADDRPQYGGQPDDTFYGGNQSPNYHYDYPLNDAGDSKFQAGIPGQVGR